MTRIGIQTDVCVAVQRGLVCRDGLTRMADSDGLRRALEGRRLDTSLGPVERERGHGPGRERG
jgi:hypothetical protein